MLNKKSVDDINVKGKKVLVRCDFNVPLIDGKITDENRLVAALPTIKKLIADGGKVILCSHLGKPKGQPVPELSLASDSVCNGLYDEGSSQRKAFGESICCGKLVGRPVLLFRILSARTV